MERYTRVYTPQGGTYGRYTRVYTLQGGILGGLCQVIPLWEARVRVNVSYVLPGG